MTELAMERLFVVVFTQTGRDYFGPLLGKLNKKTRTNQVIPKWYDAIFTCLSFILVLRRFRLRRGYPKSITNDNGT